MKSIILSFLVFISFSSFAQKLSLKEKEVFDIVAFKRKQVGEYEIVQKWVGPIRYKIYGDTSAYILKEVDSTFSKMRQLTKLDIKRTYKDDEVNYLLVFGKNENDFSDFHKPAPKAQNFAGAYTYKSDKNAQIYWAQNLINISKKGSREDVKFNIKRAIVKSFGFFKTSTLERYSLFNPADNNILKINDFDSHLIATLYLPNVKPGMTKDQVDGVLK